MGNFLQILVITFAPLLAIRVLKWGRWDHLISPVVLAYGIGILLTNFNLISIDASISESFSEATVLLAIPLLLYSTDLVGWFKHAKKTMLSFVICVVCGMIMSAAVAFFLQGEEPQSWLISGMLVGVYTGGTPNMQAIGMALGAEEDLFVLMNAADIFCGGIYLLLLTSVLPKLLAYWLPPYATSANTTEGKKIEKTKIDWKSLFQMYGLTILIVGISVGLPYLYFGNLKNGSVIILLLTTLSVLASLVPRIRKIIGTFESGEYLLLMFCVAVGLLCDFELLLAKGTNIIIYTAYVLIGTVVLHFLLVRIFRIDRDTAIITSTAALYGPVFIGQVASVINNRELVFSGVATGLVGMALGNYLGIGMAELLRYLLF